MHPFYQPVLDLIATHPPPNGRLDLILSLCQAIDAAHRERIPLITAQVIKDVNPEMSPPVLIPDTVIYEAMLRLLFLAEHADLQLLLDWYHRPISFARSQRDRVSEHWIGIFERIILPVANTSEKDLDRRLGEISKALGLLIPEHHAAAKDERQTPIRFTPGDAPGGWGTQTYSPGSRSAVLADGIRKLVEAWMISHQQLLDAALQAVASKNAAPRQSSASVSKLESLRARWLKVHGPTFGDARFGNAAAQDIRISLATIRYGRSGQHRYLDAFPPPDSRGDVGFTLYDREAVFEPSGKALRLSDLLRYRSSQLHNLLDEYGLYYTGEAPRDRRGIEAERDRRAKFKARRAIIDRVADNEAASLALRSDGDLVSFGCAFVQAAQATAGAGASPDVRLQAFAELLAFLAKYLGTQTVQSEFNLDETPPYLDRLFPRAINGALLHDCGVYAVRVAFVLLSLADCVFPPSAGVSPHRASFILLPLHVGLLVEIDGLSPLVLHNQNLIPVDDEMFDAAEKEWSASPEATDPTDTELLRQKVLEDVAAQHFLRDVDLPLIRLPLSSVSAPPKKVEIEKAYKKLVVRKIDGLLNSEIITNPTKRDYQFDLRFLFALDLEKRWYDNTVVAFWNEECFRLWETFKNLVNSNPESRKRFANRLEALINAVNASYDKEVRPEKEKLTREFRIKSELVGKGAQRVTTATRLREFSRRQIGPVGDVFRYVDELRKPIARVPDPPFASRASFLTRIGE